MWALRSYLRRPITSSLRSARRHDATHTVVPCRNLIAGPRRRFSDATNGDPHQHAAAAAKRHLYLVLDDRKKDYGIYKLDVDADLLDGDDVGSDSTTAPRRLPHPVHIRIEVTEDCKSAQFAAAGSCIVATGRSPYEELTHSNEYAVVTILYDIKTPAVSVSTHPTLTLQDGYEVAVPVGNRLYVFDSYYSNDQDGFHCMTTLIDGEDAADGEVKQQDWGWSDDSGSSRIGWSDSCATCYSSEKLPFSAHEIQAYAVHPRDRTIFLSAPVSYKLPSGAGWRYGVDTFVYHTTGDNYRWTRYGRWALPFKGHAHYDHQLNMWVGLHVEEKGEGTSGYLAACDIPSSQHEDYPREGKPNWTVSIDKILLDDPDQRRIDFKLVYMSERGEYCLVERLGRPGASEKKECLDSGEECLLRITMFRFKYADDDEEMPYYLKIMDRRARSYKVSRCRGDFEARAFWI